MQPHDPEPAIVDDSPQAVAARVGIPFVSSLAGLSFSSEFLRTIPIHFAREHAVLGLVGAEAPGAIRLAMSRLGGGCQLDLLIRLFPGRIVPLLCPGDVLQRAINEAYQTRTGQADEAISKLDAQEAMETLEAMRSREDLLDGASRAPVVKLVNMILFEAVQADASDIHVQPSQDALSVRVRVDGVLYNSYELPISVQDEVTSRIKVMGKMNIAEKRLPQDGRATVEVGDRHVDLRIASLPTSYGERVVIRLLDKSARLYRLGELGMPAGTMNSFRRLIAAEHGLVLVTGPTGSGKSTTLYAALLELDGVKHNILTLEDPIEYQLEGISQTQVNDKKGMTFAAGLRNILRQDPDIIMVGEIRDRETALMAIQSAQTGHLVFSTLHTNDAASAVTRLADLGIEPYLLASTLNGVLAQRLVRRICPKCAEPNALAPPDLVLNVGRQPPTALTRGRGCNHCRGTGFKGRVGIFELLALTDDIREHVTSRSSAVRIRQVAVSGGMRTLRDDGIEKVLNGVTTLSEVEQATVQDSESATVEGADTVNGSPI